MCGNSCWRVCVRLDSALGCGGDDREDSLLPWEHDESTQASSPPAMIRLSGLRLAARVRAGLTYTLTRIEVDIREFPAASLAIAQRVCWPFATFFAFQVTK